LYIRGGRAMENIQQNMLGREGEWISWGPQSGTSRL
jgi:hypothetical protein